MAQKTSTEAYRKMIAAERAAPMVLSELDPDTGEPIVIQPEKGVGCRMTAEKYSSLVLDMRRGKPMCHIVVDSEVTLSALSIIRARHKDIIPSRAKQSLDKLHEVHEVSADLVLRLVRENKIPPGVAPILFGVSFDKLSTALGTNIQRHEHIHAVLPQDDVKTALSSLKADPEPAIDVEIAHKNRGEIQDAQVLPKKGGGGGHKSSGAEK